MSIFKLKFGKWVTENRFKELAVSLYNSYCKITWIRVNYSKERLIWWRLWKFRKQFWSTSEQVMPSPRLKVFLLFVCSLSFVWFVWSKSHSRNQVKTKFVVELYQFTVINLQVYFFPSKSTRIKRQFFDNHIQFITTILSKTATHCFMKTVKIWEKVFQNNEKQRNTAQEHNSCCFCLRQYFRDWEFQHWAWTAPRMACRNAVLVWVQYNEINKSSFTPLLLARESLTFRRSEVKQKTCTKRHWFWWLMFNKAPL